MSEEWVKAAIASLEAADQRERADLRRAELAEAGAPGFFDRLARCVQGDLRDLVAAKPWLALEFQHTPSDSLLVMRNEFPSATLKVERAGVRLRICRSFRPDSMSERALEESEALLAADLAGNILARYDSRRFTDESDLSEALLMPILNFLRTHRP